ncbi:DUF4013 domain-containing protein [Halorubrum cibi]|uniref:DUF4013 domain-containing protein n=1 Tax=Halorubrum cibi TaxID=413815 RepID=A0A521BJ72_9EURY|nr:DUF4013 domain-containing protein [Halorubrum cibi]SMO47143.1 Protein of unknown function [Halorubrum cibi]
MLRAALATPLRSEDAAGTLVIGTVLTLLAWTLTPIWVIGTLSAPVLVLAAPLALAPTFVGRGYLLRVVAVGIETVDETETVTGSRIGSAADVSPQAPPFVRWGRLYRDGVASALLTVAYLLPLVVGLAAVGVAGAFVELGRVDPTPLAESIAGADSGGTAGVEAGVPTVAPVYGIVGAFVAVVSLAYLVAFAYVRPAALAALAAGGRLRDGLRPTAVGRVALSGEYAVAWSLAMVTLLTGYVLAGPFVPLLVGIGGVFAVRIVVHTLYGLGAGDVVNHARLRTPVDDEDGVADSEASIEPSAVFAEPSEGRGSVRPEADPAVQTGRSVPRGIATPPPEEVGTVALDSLVEGAGDGNGDGKGGDPLADRDDDDLPDDGTVDEFDWGT